MFHVKRSRKILSWNSHSPISQNSSTFAHYNF